MRLLSWALTSGKETNTYCHTPGRPPIHLAFHHCQPLTPQKPQICHISPLVSVMVISSQITEPYLWPHSISTCSFPIGTSANLPRPRYHSCHVTFMILLPLIRVYLCISIAPQISCCLLSVCLLLDPQLTLTSLKAEMSPPLLYNPRSWNMTLSK